MSTAFDSFGNLNQHIKPKIAITIGDPTGIGPEIIVKALASGQLNSHCRPLVIGRTKIIRRALQRSGIETVIQEVASVSEWDGASIAAGTGANVPTLYCLQVGTEEAEKAIERTVDARGGQLAFDALCIAARFALDRQVDAIVTAPLHKVALQMAGHDWPGHTELLASLCGVNEVAMMLYLPPGRPRHGGTAGFGVVHVTLHMALREVFQHLTGAAILEKIRLAHDVFTRIKSSSGMTDQPRIAVAALNPHAGESGRFGDEEATLIEPAVQLARDEGIDVVGPLAVDTLMPKGVDGAFDAVVAMYHDQGHIALKLLDMFDAVNITLGLPILRTSVAHGTAHDIAWQNQAEASGMIQAIVTAARLSQTNGLSHGVQVNAIDREPS
jgi:4-hydroxythreonine-4-phosphate dehydrogenase